MSRFWIAYENDPTAPLFGAWGTVPQAIAGAAPLIARPGPPLAVVDREGNVVHPLARAAMAPLEPTAWDEVASTLGTIVARCAPASPAAERAASYLACAIVRDRRDARASPAP